MNMRGNKALTRTGTLLPRRFYAHSSSNFRAASSFISSIDIHSTYLLPEEELFAHLYLDVRDREDVVRRIAAPQPHD